MMTALYIIGTIAFIALSIFPGMYIGTMVAFSHSSDNIIEQTGRWIAFIIVSCVIGFLSLLFIVMLPVIILIAWIFSKVISFK